MDQLGLSSLIEKEDLPQSKANFVVEHFHLPLNAPPRKPPADRLIDRSQMLSRPKGASSREALSQWLSELAYSDQKTYEQLSTPDINVTARPVIPRVIPNVQEVPSATEPPETPLSSASSVRESFSPTPPSHTGPILPTLQSLVPRLGALSKEIQQDLHVHLTHLMRLNRSRREALLAHLNRLAGLTSSESSPEPADALLRWIEGPLSPVQEKALEVYLEEVALLCLGQALLLKAWSDRGIRRWQQQDLSHLNWALSHALKPHVPVDREGWRITRPNLYSWYNPSSPIQKSIWEAFQQWKLTDQGPSLLAGLLRLCRNARPELPELYGYDARFFSALWEQMPHFGFDLSKPCQQGPIQRRRMLFSPTLRDGTMVRTCSPAVHWIGLEAYLYQLLVAELSVLWAGPLSPPLWAHGTGLSVHHREQLSMNWNSPKPSPVLLLQDIEACDLALVLEERPIRTQGRSAEAGLYRAELEPLSYFKKIKDHGTTLGDLQASVALNKLRPGGLLWWVREEPLSSSDGDTLLRSLLERAKLLCEWDFRGIEHSLPLSIPLFPRYLYLFTREVEFEKRNQHHPKSLRVSGQIRSHVEVPLILEDALRHYYDNQKVRGQWKIHEFQSPTAQVEWMERWPDPTEQTALEKMNRLRELSTPLGQLAIVRAIAAKEKSWRSSKALHGLWLKLEQSNHQGQLLAEPLPPTHVEIQEQGFLVFLPGQHWLGPIRLYLESKIVTEWLDFHAEKKRGKWHLKEQTLKYIPIPHCLTKILQGPHPQDPTTEDPHWNQLLGKIKDHPDAVIAELKKQSGEPLKLDHRAAVFVKAAHALEQLQTTQAGLFSMVGKESKIQWRELLAILPPQEKIGFSMHTKIQLTGALPPHLPIHQMQRVHTPRPGILFSTETGLHLTAHTEDTRLVDMLSAQLEDLHHPTWRELTQFITLPRDSELAMATANDILRSHHQQVKKKEEFIELLSSCLTF